MLLDAIDQLANKAKLRLVKAGEAPEGGGGDGATPGATPSTEAEQVEADKALNNSEKLEAAKAAAAAAAEEMGDVVEEMAFGKVAVMRDGPMGLDIVGNSIRKVKTLHPSSDSTVFVTPPATSRSCLVHKVRCRISRKVTRSLG